MERLSLILVLALSGCSALVSSALEDTDGGTADATVDGGLFDCRRMPDGTSCGEGLICISNLCESSRCGDGIVAEDEDCDELDDVTGDGCEPNSCTFTCTEDTDCEDGNSCTTDTCSATNVCEQSEAGPETTCEPPSGATGTCLDGLCVGEGCGNGVIDAGEDCDDESSGCIACQFGCEEDEECRDEFFCNGEETCDDITHECEGASVLTCDDADECTLDSCSESSQACINTLIDEDGDGYAADTLTCANPNDGGDCAPGVMSINPGAAELCDTIDNDCDEEIDETMEVLCFPDRDGDGFGGGGGTLRECMCDDGEVGQGGDCNDLSPSARPTQDDYFPEPHCRGTPAACFDYNCNGMLEAQVLTLGSCGIVGSACGGTRGWADTRPPTCGNSATWIGGCTGNAILGCRAVMSTQTQQCR